MSSKYWSPSFTNPEWLQAYSTPRNVTSSGFISCFFISSNSEIASLP
uniref:Uncharacterized protein n=1 Tax=Arundo donax TaxID=35708 RepID=A0A0A8XZN3_ARUDO